MRCSKAQLEISAAMDGELDQTSRAELARHLEDCPGCLRYQTDLERCRVLMRESEMAPSAQFEWKVQLGISRALRERAAGGEESRRSGRFWLPAGVTALVTAGLVLFVGLWWIGGSPAPQESNPDLAPSSRPALAQRGLQADPLGQLEEQSPFRPQVVNAMPEWGRHARPDWRTPPSLQGRISTVNDLRLGLRSPYYTNSTWHDSSAVKVSLPKER